MRILSRLAAILVVLVVLGVGVRFVLGYTDAWQKNSQWIDEVAISQAGRSSGLLFDEAKAAGVVWFDAAASRIMSQPCEARYDPDVAIKRDVPISQEGRAALDRLCASGTGKAILDELDDWNDSFRILAVRDNHDKSNACDDGTAIGDLVLVAGCKKPRWTARIMGQGAAGDIPVPSRGRGAPAFRDFAVIAEERMLWAADWLMVAVPQGDQPFALDLAMAASARELSVDLIGQPEWISVGAQRAPLDPTRAAQEVRVGGARVTVALLCEDKEADGAEAELKAEGRAGPRDCQAVRAVDGPHGWRLTIRLDRAQAAKLSIGARAIRSLPAAFRKAGDPDGGRQTIQRTTHVVLACATSGSCDLEWKVPTGTQSLKQSQYRLVMRDGETDLVDASGRILPQAIEMGLAAAVGFGPADFGSLAAALASGPKGGGDVVRLTLDKNLQKLAQDTIVEEMSERVKRGGKEAKGRGGLVLIDADQNPGEVLAMGSWPTFETGLNTWDLQALAAGRDTANPLAGHLWRAGDIHAMPGSTYKLVTAIAAIREADKRGQELIDLISGKTPIDRMASQFFYPSAGASAMTFPGISADKFSVNNAGGGSIGGDLIDLASSQCPKFAAGGSQLGVCEATIRSSNLYFAGLGRYLDERAILRDGGRERTDVIEDLAIARGARALFPVRTPGKFSPGIDMTRGLLPGAFRLNVEPIVLSVMFPDGGRRISLATNSYGQGVTATPIAVTSIYASLATRKTVHPRLVQTGAAGATNTANEGEPIIDPGSPIQKQLFAAVTAGLHGVVMTNRGTANRYFADAPYRERVYGKTGTATTTETRGERQYSAWFAGWINPGPKGGKGMGRRVAFACWVTHTRDFGGTACAPVIKKLLSATETMEPIP